MSPIGCVDSRAVVTPRRTVRCLPRRASVAALPALTFAVAVLTAVATAQTDPATLEKARAAAAEARAEIARLEEEISHATDPAAIATKRERQAYLWWDVGDLRRSIECCSAILEVFPEHHARLTRAKYEHLCGDDRGALQDYNDHFASHKVVTDWDIHPVLELLDPHADDETIAECTTLLRYGDGLAPSSRAEVLEHRAAAYEHKGLFGRAAADWVLLRRNSPWNDDYRKNLQRVIAAPGVDIDADAGAIAAEARTALDHADSFAAIERCVTALALRPTLPSAQIRLAQALAERHAADRDKNEAALEALIAARDAAGATTAERTEASAAISVAASHAAANEHQALLATKPTAKDSLAAMLRRQGAFHAMANELDAALACCDRAIEVEDDPYTHGIRARVHELRNEYGPARDDYRVSLRGRSPQRDSGWLTLHELELEHADHQAILEDCRTIQAAFPGELDSRDWAIQATALAGDVDAANVALDAALCRLPNDVRLLALRCSIALHAGDIARGVDGITAWFDSGEAGWGDWLLRLAERAAATAPGEAAWRQLADGKRGANDALRSAALLAAIQFQHSDQWQDACGNVAVVVRAGYHEPALLCLAATVHAGTGDVEGARNDLALLATPDLAPAWADRVATAVAAASARGPASDAQQESLVRLATTLHARCPGSEKVALAVRDVRAACPAMYARLEAANDAIRRTIAGYETTLRLEPENFVAAARCAVLQLVAGQPGQATKTLSDSLLLPSQRRMQNGAMPSDAELQRGGAFEDVVRGCMPREALPLPHKEAVLRIAGAFAALRLHAPAIDLISDEIVAHPDDAELYATRARLRPDADEARDDVRRALELCHGKDDALRHLAIDAYHGIDKTQAARDASNEVIAARPNDPRAWLARARSEYDAWCQHGRSPDHTRLDAALADATHSCELRESLDALRLMAILHDAMNGATQTMDCVRRMLAIDPAAELPDISNTLSILAKAEESRQLQAEADRISAKVNADLAEARARAAAEQRAAEDEAARLATPPSPPPAPTAAPSFLDGVLDALRNAPPGGVGGWDRDAERNWARSGWIQRNIDAEQRHYERMHEIERQFFGRR